MATAPLGHQPHHVPVPSSNNTFLTDAWLIVLNILELTLSLGSESVVPLT